jgi:hypothetical protein
MMAVGVALSVIGFGAENVNYDSVRQGQVPPGWTTHAGQARNPGPWEVRADKTAPSHPNVMQGRSGANGETAAPVAIFDKIVCRDGDLSVKFRISGDQRADAAGIIWRYQDSDNYYLLRLGADNSAVLERIRNGVAEVINSGGGKRAGEALNIRPGQWHVVKVIFRGPDVRVFFGNRSLFTAQDSGLLTPGKTGLWARGVTGAAFDDFRIDKKG